MLQEKFGKPAQIYVRTKSGDTFGLLVKGCDTVLDTKDKIKEELGFEDFFLIVGGKALENGRTLVDCNVRPWSVLDLVPRVRGGMQLEITNRYGGKLKIEVDTSQTELDLYGEFSNHNIDQLECSC